MKLRTQIKWLDPFTVACIFLAAGTTLAGISAFGKKKEFLIIYAVIFFVLGAIILYRNVKDGKGLLLENDYEGPVNFKPEAGCMPVSLPPGSGYPIPVDGINTGVKPGKVFKLRSGTNVYINPAGDVKSYSPVSALVNGWRDLDYFSDDELECWAHLF